MIESIVSCLPNIIIGSCIGMLFAFSSSQKRAIDSLTNKFYQLKFDLPYKCVSQHEHEFLIHRVRNLEEEIRIIHLLMKKNKEKE